MTSAAMSSARNTVAIRSASRRTNSPTTFEALQLEARIARFGDVRRDFLETCAVGFAVGKRHELPIGRLVHDDSSLLGRWRVGGLTIGIGGGCRLPVHVALLLVTVDEGTLELLTGMKEATHDGSFGDAHRFGHLLVRDMPSTSRMRMTARW